MRSLFLVLMLLVLEVTVVAQGSGSERQEMDHKLNSLRFRETIPPFGLEKISSLMKKNRGPVTEFEVNRNFPQSAFDSLTPKEKFTYCIAFPESFHQICAFLPPLTKVDKKIFSRLPVKTEGLALSKRQSDFLKNNARMVIDLMKQTISDSVFIGLNYKKAILQLNAVGMIPALQANYRQTKDKDLLTVMLVLMTDNKYKPYQDSAIGKEIYQNSATRSYGSNFIVYNEKNENLILQMATDFYVSAKK